MNLNRRVRALERATGVGAGCDVCGYAPGARLEFRVHFADEAHDDGPEFCPKRGRKRVFRIRFQPPRGPLAPPAGGPG